MRFIAIIVAIIAIIAVFLVSADLLFWADTLFSVSWMPWVIIGFAAFVILMIILLVKD